MTRANEIAKSMRAAAEWQPDECKELCELAGLEREYADADGETFENVVYEAAKRLNVEI